MEVFLLILFGGKEARRETSRFQEVSPPKHLFYGFLFLPFERFPVDHRKPEDEPFQRPFDPREDRFRFRVDRRHVNGFDPREISSRHVRHELVAHDRRGFTIPPTSFHDAPAATRKRFQRHRLVLEIIVFRDFSDSAFFPVGEKANVHARGFQSFEPLQNPVLKQIRVVPLQRAVHVEQNVPDFNFTQNGRRKFVYDVHLVLRQKGPEKNSCKE